MCMVWLTIIVSLRVKLNVQHCYLATWAAHLKTSDSWCDVAVFTPIVMNALEKRGFLSRYPWSAAPIQLALLGVCLTFATPMCCALFSQRASISVSSLDAELQVIVHRIQNYETASDLTENINIHVQNCYYNCVHITSVSYVIF